MEMWSDVETYGKSGDRGNHRSYEEPHPQRGDRGNISCKVSTVVFKWTVETNPENRETVGIILWRADTKLPPGGGGGGGAGGRLPRQGSLSQYH